MALFTFINVLILFIIAFLLIFVGVAVIGVVWLPCCERQPLPLNLPTAALQSSWE